MNINNQKGSALYTVLILSTAALILILIFIKTQYIFTTPSIKNAHKLQALLNARSGIWYGLGVVQKESRKDFSQKLDTEKPISDLQFNDDMFEFEKEVDTTDATFSNSVITVIPFDSSYGQFTMSIIKDAFFIKLHSEGKKKDISSIIEANIGSRPFENSDTVLFLETAAPVLGTGFTEGKTFFIEKSIDSSTISSDERFFIDMNILNEIISSYEDAISIGSDTNFSELPLTIFYEDEFESMSDTIRGSLFLDGSSRDLDINGNDRKIVVYEELQITGTVNLSNITFIVAGDIKLLDESNLKKATLFSNSRLFIGGESHFSGNAICKNLIEIYDEAIVNNGSFILSRGKKNKSKALKNDSLKNRGFSINIRDKAKVDGILFDLSKNSGGIRTESETFIHGVLWSNSRVLHSGEMEGIIKAKNLVDEDHLESKKENFLSGDVKEIDDISKYIFPAFLGKPKLLNWIEL